MKSKKLILALTMTIAMGLGVTAYASTTQSTTGSHQRAGMMMITGMRGYDYVELILKNNLGMTDAEITAGLNSGKTMYDLAKEKGMTEDEFKEALLEERNKAIDKAVTNGTITNEEGDSIIETLKNNIDTCTGTPGQKTGRNGTGRVNLQGAKHMSGGGFRDTGNCYIDNTVK